MSTQKYSFSLISSCLKCNQDNHDHHHRLINTISFPFKMQPFKKLQEIAADATMKIKKNAVQLVDAFVDSTFKFVDQPFLSSQSNFGPVEELGNPIQIEDIEGSIPDEFPQGVYLRNGPNPLFGGYKSTVSVFGKSSRSWIEGEGILHALYLNKSDGGKWIISYYNKYIESNTFITEKERNKPAFLPAIEGDHLAVLSAYLLNWMRFGEVEKHYGNTNIIEHGGKYFATAENHPPQEVDIMTLKTIGKWHLDATWKRSCTSHPKKIPFTGELVMYGIAGLKPHFQLGIVSADGERIVHQVDVKLKRCTLSHEIGVTERYNVILDFPLTINVARVFKGGPLFKFEDQSYARIGVMPHYGNADTIKWFEVEPCSVFHILNCFEEGDEVVVVACKALGSLIPGPDYGMNKLEWYSNGFKHPSLVEDSQEGKLFTWVQEWRLNVRSGEVKTRNLSGHEYYLEIPFINPAFSGIRNKYGFAQVGDCIQSSNSGMPKFGGLAKLYFQEESKEPENWIKVECHEFPERTFCSGAAFVPNPGGVDEDDGWVITFVHNEETNLSQVYIISARKFTEPPVAKISIPGRVPYGFHGAFMHIS